MTKHDGDCSIYRSMCNHMPYDGICTCGYGAWYMWNNGGDDQHLMSKERWDSIKRTPEQIAEAEQMFEQLFGYIEESPAAFFDKETDERIV